MKTIALVTEIKLVEVYLSLHLFYFLMNENAFLVIVLMLIALEWILNVGL